MFQISLQMSMLHRAIIESNEFSKRHNKLEVFLENIKITPIKNRQRKLRGKNVQK